MSKKEVKEQEKKGSALAEMDLTSPGGDLQARASARPDQVDTREIYGEVPQP